MYLVGQGHEHLGPGTSMVQFLGPQLEGAFNGGLGAVGGVEEFFGDCKTMRGGCAESRGFGCAGCGGKCKTGCGMGLFDGGLDPSSWGWQEWAVVGVGGYVLTSIFFTGRRAVRQVRSGVSSRVRGARRRLAARVAG